MFSSDRILTLDVGASKILLGEFSVKGSSAPVLTSYAVAERDSLDAGTSSDGFLALADTVREMMSANGIKPAPLYVMLPGQTVFPRFMKIPGATSDMVDNLVREEAAENLPFPLDQVVWDYWRLGTDPTTGELDALIVATKTETAMDAAALAESLGLPLAMVDAAPLALYNAVRFNYPEADGCTLVLDVGARTTNLVFLEGDKVFMRTIPIAGNTMTNEIARGLGIEPAEAEAIKKEIGFVALGGTYAVADDERADRVSKIVRNIATRLHSEVTRSINFYRSQQGGSAPVRLLLTGGSSLMRHLDVFFHEKLGVEVAFLNPFTNLSVAETLAEDSVGLFLMAPSAGLALRASVKCPVEISLIPSTIVEERRFRRRLPFFAVAVAGVLLTLLCWVLYANGQQSRFEDSEKKLQQEIKRLKANQRQLGTAVSESEEAVDRVLGHSAIANSRASFAMALDELRGALLPGMWITKVDFQPVPELGPDNEAGGAAPEEGEGSAVSYGKLILTTRLFTQDLPRPAAAESSRRGARQAASAGDSLKEALGRSPLFRPLSINEQRIKNGRVREYVVELELARPLGRPDVSWVPVESPAASDGEAPPDDGTPEAGETPEETEASEPAETDAAAEPEEEDDL